MIWDQDTIVFEARRIFLLCLQVCCLDDNGAPGYLLDNRLFPAERFPLQGGYENGMVTRLGTCKISPKLANMLQ